MSRTCRRLLTAWLILGSILFLLSWHKAAEAQCPPGRCGVGVGANVGRLSVDLRAQLAPVVRTSCVVPVFVGSDPSPAAGVYVGTIHGQGVVLTCWHAAKYGVRAVAAAVAGVVPIGIHKDKYGYDMAAVIVPPLDVPAATVGTAPGPGETVEIIGYPLGRFGRHRGRVAGYFRPEGDQPWGDLSIDTASQDGDSGGAVLGSSGALVGLLWGTRSDGCPGSVAVSAPAIADFLRRIQIMLAGQSTAGSSEVETRPPPARLPLEPVVPIEKEDPVVPDRSLADSLRGPLEGLRDRLNQLEERPPDNDAENRLGQIEDSVRGIAASAVTADGIRDVLASSATASPSLADAAIPVALAALGWTGPPAIAAVLGLRILSGLIRRRRKDSKKRSEGTSEASDGFLPRNSEEARQFLQLSRLEGRSPLHDALIGRITFDKLDEIIDSQSDGPEADWARSLRRQLEDRFNEMAPPAVFTAAGQTP